VAALYVEHGEELRRFLQGILRDAQLASDCLQATFVKMVERGHQTREETRKAWLFRVAYNEALAYRRRQAVGDKIVRRVAWYSSGSSNHSNNHSHNQHTHNHSDYSHTDAAPADEPATRFESVQAVREALDQLPPEQRQVVRMRIYEEKTFAVIAQELSIPLGTALARMRSAMMKLRAKFSDDDANS
jgi:RNA polymerase sigma-70 factor (ECF subfamily)